MSFGVPLLQLRQMSTEILKDIFLKSVQAVQPRKLIQDNIQLVQTHLLVRGEKYVLQKPCFLVGFGKAVFAMALEVEQILGSDLQMGVVTVPEGILRDFKNPSRIKFLEGAKDNLPDHNALKGAEEIKKVAVSLTEDDLLLVLISGGGSALLPLPKPPISLEEKQELIKELGRKGADIVELNTVRKQISVLKGGGLADLAYPARVLALVLSDIVGDPLGFIASGPTTFNQDQPDEAIRIIKKYGLYDTIPSSIQTVLLENVNKNIRKSSDRFDRVRNFIIGNNKIAAQAATLRARELGFQTALLSTSITGHVTEVSQLYADIAEFITTGRHFERLNEFPEFLQEVSKFDPTDKICIVGGGEPTVIVTGDGKGGRNQHLALDFCTRLNCDLKSNISLLSAGTDGMDGPTDAAGAIATSDLVHYCTRANIKPENYLNNNDSYGFYSSVQDGRYLIKTGHTGTNVMDIHLLLVTPNSS